MRLHNLLNRSTKSWQFGARRLCFRQTICLVRNQREKRRPVLRDSFWNCVAACYGRSRGLGRGRGVGVGLRGGVAVAVGVGVGVGVAVAVAVGVAVAAGVAVGVGVGLAPLVSG
jgi:hypothetical protein